MKPEEGDVIRIENMQADNKPPSCCMCLDVRIGAVLIGLLYLVIYSAWLAVNTPKVLFSHHEDSKTFQYYDFHYYAEKHNVDRNAVAMVIACLIFLLVVMMMYGAALRRSNFILPFFCWQVFDMCRLVMTAATMISYADRVKFHLETFDSSYDNLKHISLQRFRMMLVTVSLIVLTVNYYMMTIIWDCFKHSKKVEESRAKFEPSPNYMVCQTDMETMTLLPSYDDVVKSSPPPAYAQ